ncbi:MAG: helix-turn-helix domain-containing protein [Candidatus Bathyarchaeota archaeon]|nr:helix-turn-helix domain-containing protein [Candidatus Termiticorpusculum sp.]
MSSEIEALNKILKDKTRRKIILTLTDRESLSYTELMETLRIDSTGTLNYHLKVLGDLLGKTDSGQYRLSEKGKLASRFLTEFPEQDGTLKTKKVWWRRFWIVAILFPTLWMLIVLYLYFSDYLDAYRAMQATFGFIFAIMFTYFFYRMIRPNTKKQNQKEQNRTVQDVFVSGRRPKEVKEEIQKWIREEGIVIEAEREEFVRGRLGIPSGLGLTAPKYFEVSLKSDQNGVMVHTEGWISVYNVSERSFSNKILAFGNIPRKKGWDVINRLWQKLRAISK